MRCLHVAADIKQRASGGGTQEIDEKLLFAAHAVLAAMLPEPAEPGILCQARKQVFHHRRDAVIAAETCVKRFRHGAPTDAAFMAATVSSPPEGRGANRRLIL